MSRGVVVSVVAVAALAGLAGRADAYPQFQLSRDQTCTGCHVSPAGGGMLNENGLGVAENISQFGMAPEFFYGKVPLPDWLMLSGDLRGASGYIQSPEQLLASFPMQVEINAHAKIASGVSAYVTGGLRSAEVGNEAATRVWSREHYLMWRQKPDENEGLYVRLGRFAPVFGQRLVEHPAYTRRWGGNPLYADTYALAVEYVTPKYEVHATGFIEDPILSTPEHSDGGALLAEYRLSETLSVGGEFMYTKAENDEKFRYGVLAKAVLPMDFLIQFEGQFMNQNIEPIGAPNQIVAYLQASKFLNDWLMLDVGLGYFNQNIRITELHREALDLNLHWFATSHVEAIFTGRLEMLAFGSGGESSGYALVQLHYRM